MHNEDGKLYVGGSMNIESKKSIEMEVLLDHKFNTSKTNLNEKNNKVECGEIGFFKERKNVKIYDTFANTFKCVTHWFQLKKINQQTRHFIDSMPIFGKTVDRQEDVHSVMNGIKVDLLPIEIGVCEKKVKVPHCFLLDFYRTPSLTLNQSHHFQFGIPLKEEAMDEEKRKEILFAFITELNQRFSEEGSFRLLMLANQATIPQLISEMHELYYNEIELKVATEFGKGHGKLIAPREVTGMHIKIKDFGNLAILSIKILMNFNVQSGYDDSWQAFVAAKRTIEMPKAELAFPLVNGNLPQASDLHVKDSFSPIFAQAKEADVFFEQF